jgi:cytochrome c-type biogenesis protein
MLIGLLGVIAVVLGSAFIGFQKGAWIALGAIYVLIGLGYATGRVGLLRRSLGPSLARLSGLRGSAALGALFGLNIPACAAPLLLALLGTAKPIISTSNPPSLFDE